MNMSRTALFVLIAIFGCFSLLSAQDTTVSEEFSKAVYLKKLTGFYVDQNGGESEIRLNEEGALIALTPGGDMMTLASTVRDEFDVKEMQGLHFKFKRNEEGLVSSAELAQPSGDKIELKRKMD